MVIATLSHTFFINKIIIIITITDNYTIKINKLKVDPRLSHKNFRILSILPIFKVNLTVLDGIP